MTRAPFFANFLIGCFAASRLAAGPAHAQEDRQTYETFAPTPERRPFAAAQAARLNASPAPAGLTIAPSAPASHQPPGQYSGRSGVLRPDSQLLHESRPALDEVFKILATRQRGLSLNVWFPGVPALGNEEVAQGAAVAQGVALRTGYVPVSVSCVPGVVPGRFNVAVGTVNQLQGMLTGEELKAISNGYLLLRKIPNRADTHLLIITGRTPEGVDNAILSLGIARERLPGVATAAIHNVVLPKAPPFLRREPLRADSVYTLQQLQDTGTVLTPMANRRLRVELMLPGDFSPKSEGDFVLDLHFSQQSRAFQSSDRVSVRVNDLSSDIASGDATPIVAGSGAGGARASVGIPARLFRQGFNIVDIDFPGSSSDGFLVYPDSTLSVPPCAVAPPLPNLQITARTAYPFVGQPDGSELMVYLAGQDIETVESAWTFLAKLAQMSNTLLHAAEFNSATEDNPSPRPTSRHVIAVGDFASVPEEFRRGMPADIFREIKEVPQEEPTARGSNLKEAIMRSRKSAANALFEPVAISPVPVHPNPTQPEWNRNERGYLGSFPPEENLHGWVLLLTAQTGPLLRQRTEELIHPSFWEGIRGGGVYWNHAPESFKVYTETPRPTAAVNTSNPDLFVEMPLGERYSTRAWMIATGITLLILVVSLTKSLQKNTTLRDYLQS